MEGRITNRDTLKIGEKVNFRRAKCCYNCIHCQGKHINDFHCEMDIGVIISFDPYYVCNNFKGNKDFV